jgi:hypothetical protein
VPVTSRAPPRVRSGGWPAGAVQPVCGASSSGRGDLFASACRGSVSCGAGCCRVRVCAGPPGVRLGGRLAGALVLPSAGGTAARPRRAEADSFGFCLSRVRVVRCRLLPGRGVRQPARRSFGRLAGRCRGSDGAGGAAARLRRVEADSFGFCLLRVRVVRRRLLPGPGVRRPVRRSLRRLAGRCRGSAGCRRCCGTSSPG